MDYKKGEKIESATIKYLDWKIPFVVGIIATFLILGLLLNIKQFFRKLYDVPIFDKLYEFFIVMMIINSGLATYTISLYYYRISRTGIKGPKGLDGKRGDRGKSEGCDLYTPRVGYMKREPDVKVEKYSVNLKDALKGRTVNLDINKQMPHWRPITKNNGKEVDDSGIEEYLGSKYAPCLSENNDKWVKCKYSQNIRVRETNNKNEKKDTYKPFTGAIINYDIYSKGRSGDVYTMQFLYDKNKILKKEESEIGLVYDVNGKFGSKENKGKNIEFTCPPHSALYKVESLHEENKENKDSTKFKNASIKGIKFHCRDIKTGDKVKILNNKDQLVDDVHFGVEPTSSNKDFLYSSVECGYNKERNVPGFISNVTPVHSDEGISAIKFNSCSYYHDTEKK